MIEQPEGMVGGLSNCGVVAIASALGLKYPVVWDAVKKAGGATYIIHTGNHYVAVRDQQVVDQHSASPIGEHKCSKQRVKVAWKIN